MRGQKHEWALATHLHPTDCLHVVHLACRHSPRLNKSARKGQQPHHPVPPKEVVLSGWSDLTKRPAHFAVTGEVWVAFQKTLKDEVTDDGK